MKVKAVKINANISWEADVICGVKTHVHYLAIVF